MNTKFRYVGRVSFRPNARERDPVKLTKKKIAFLARADKSNPKVSKKYKGEVRTTKKGSKKLAFKQHRKESARLFAKAGQLIAVFELVLEARSRRDHANHRTLVSIRKVGVMPCSN
jgi:hypothetical protein